jgi:hypothetical protein
VTIVHKSNVLSVTDGLFRETVRAVKETGEGKQKYKDVELDEQIVDSLVYKSVMPTYDASSLTLPYRMTGSSENQKSFQSSFARICTATLFRTSFLQAFHFTFLPCFQGRRSSSSRLIRPRSLRQRWRPFLPRRTSPRLRSRHCRSPTGHRQPYRSYPLSSPHARIHGLSGTCHQDLQRGQPGA